MRKHLKIIILLSRELFPISLILYLSLLLLELIFPGFVSHNISLNIILALVIALGTVAAIAIDEGTGQEVIEPGTSDYFLMVFPPILLAIVIYLKIQTDNWTKIVVPTVTGLLLFLLGMVVVIKEDNLKLEQAGNEIALSSRSTGKLLPTLLLLLAISLISTFIFKKVIPKTPLGTPKSPAITTIDYTQGPSEFRGDISVSPGIVIKVLNGGADAGAARKFALALLGQGYRKVFIGDYLGASQENAAISFLPEDKDQAELIKRLLESNYSLVLTAPASSPSGEISVILGHQTPFSSAAGMIQILD